MQYGTVAKMRVRPGMLETLQKMTVEEDETAMAGYVGTVVYQMDADSNEVYMAVVFDSKESYVKNADSPEQNARYLEYVKCLDGEPEWHDGTVIFNRMR